ncbi:GAF domain-containing protein [Sphingomonas radiodurans]|uniref:GAF domain-containing protein n=1 Tax=Sphingomonas radiodurans TaxID=2890321 RepID=UPI001E3E1282|nr:GAF domain-containing protein [Sphingomonas radiodurans]WBH15793.1 GAF domain-containing protein [Sphingomonas radiodurans]
MTGTTHASSRADTAPARADHETFLRAVSDAIRDQTDPAPILATVADRLKAHLGVARVLYSEIDTSPEGRVFTVHRDKPDALPNVVGAHRFPPAFDDLFAACARGETIASDDLAQLGGVINAGVRDFLGAIGVRSGLTIPLVKAGQLDGVLILQHGAPRHWAADEIALAEAVAERTWATLTRARAEQALRERERDQAFLVNWSDTVRRLGAPDDIMLATMERLGRHLGATRVTYAEADYAERVFATRWDWCDGCPSLIGTRVSLDAVGAEVEREWLAGEVVRYDDVATDPRTAPRDLPVYADREIAAFVSTPLIRDGRVAAILSVQCRTVRRWKEREIELIRDMGDRTWNALERARAEASLLDRERNQAFLVEWSDRLRQLTTADQVTAETLERLTRHLGATRTTYSVNTDATGEFVVVADWCDGVNSVVGRRFSVAQVSQAIVDQWEAGRIVRYDDIVGDPRVLPGRESYYAEIEVRAFVTVPLIVEGGMRASLSVQSVYAREWREAEIQLIRDVSERLWIALDRARALAELRQRERDQAFLIGWSDLVRDESRAHAILQLTLDRVGRYLGVTRASYAESDDDGSTIHVVRDWTRDDRPSLLGARISWSALGAALVEYHLSGAPVVVDDVAHDDRFDARNRRFFARIGVVAMISVPLIRDGRIVGILSLQQAEPRTWRAGEIRLLREIADRTWATLDRAHAEEALARSREALYQTEKLSALGSLLAGVSHELNNPLSIVVAQAVMMERQAAGGDLAERAFKIRKAADRCARIVQTFLAMARAKQPERRAVSLNQVAVAALELAGYGLKTEGIRVERAFDPALPQISADTDQLHQIIINLLINAQHALAGQPDPRIVRITTALGPEPMTVVIDIADNGHGVPEEARRRIFEPFFTTKAQGEGTGVGLSFSQGLAEAHGGRLTLLPTKRGATFRLTLPVDPQQTLRRIEPAVPQPIERPQRRALVIDEEHEIAESLADFLALEGYTCEIAVGGLAARVRLTRGDYDLIVSDVLMADLEGPALYDFVCSERPDLAPRMAFSTGDTLGAAATRFIAKVQRPVLEKPFVPEAVRRFLAQMEQA